MVSHFDESPKVLFPNSFIRSLIKVLEQQFHVFVVSEELIFIQESLEVLCRDLPLFVQAYVLE